MRTLIRTSSFFTTWLAELIRQPLLLVGLVAGPFLILIAFARGVDITSIKPDVIVVQASGPDQPIRPLPEEISDYVNVVETTDDLNAAIGRLREGEVDGVAVIPPDPAGTIQEGEAVPVQIFTSDIDPVSIQFTEAYLRDQVGRLNQRTLAEAIQEAQSSIGDVDQYVATAQNLISLAREAGGNVEEVRRQIEQVQQVLGPLQQATDAVVAASRGVSFVLPGVSVSRSEVESFQQSVHDLVASVDAIESRLQTSEQGDGLPTNQELDEIEVRLADISTTSHELSNIPPDVLSAPFVLDLANISPFKPTFTGYFSPIVLILLLQHFGISLAALSMTRIRLIGLVDILRVAPIRAGEVLTGNYLSYATLMLAMAAGGFLVMRYAIDVPMYGSYVELAGSLVLLTLTVLGIGFVVAMVAGSEQSAAQFAMLALLAAVFFSGVVVSLDRLAWPMKAVSYAIPSTYAIRTVQDVMLRGVLRHPEDLVILAAGAVCAYFVAFILLRRELQPRG